MTPGCKVLCDGGATDGGGCGGGAVVLSVAPTRALFGESGHPFNMSIMRWCDVPLSIVAPLCCVGDRRC